MNINFPPVDDEFIREKIRAGYYNNAAELVRDAVRRLREADADAETERLRAALLVGNEQLDRGEGRLYSREHLAELAQRARSNTRGGKPMKSDVAGDQRT